MQQLYRTKMSYDSNVLENNLLGSFINATLPIWVFFNQSNIELYLTDIAEYKYIFYIAETISLKNEYVRSLCSS